MNNVNMEKNNWDLEVKHLVLHIRILYGLLLFNGLFSFVVIMVLWNGQTICSNSQFSEKVNFKKVESFQNSTTKIQDDISKDKVKENSEWSNRYRRSYFSEADNCKSFLWHCSSTIQGSLKGQKGERGFTGQGQKGEKGMKGDMGPIGPQGKQGDIGIIGLRGPQGKRGHRGIPGASGSPGIKGQKGEKGFQGVVGFNGRKGSQGPRGEKGETGEEGSQGPFGPPGPPGSQGPRGLKGSKGDRGLIGFTGFKGDQGEPGQKGDRGYGIPGYIGPKGQRGEKGEKGDCEVLSNLKMEEWRVEKNRPRATNRPVRTPRLRGEEQLQDTSGGSSQMTSYSLILLISNIILSYGVC